MHTITISRRRFVRGGLLLAVFLFAAQDPGFRAFCLGSGTICGPDPAQVIR